MSRKRAGASDEGNERRFALTRRQFLATTAAATLGPGLLRDELRVRFRQVSSRRVAFDVNGRTAWVIDTAFFGGTPRLAVSQEPGFLSVRLSQAYYPGTELPADFRLTLTLPEGGEAAGGGYADAAMRLELALGGLTADGVSFGRWLQSRGTWPEMTMTAGGSCSAGPLCRAQVAAVGTGWFAPDWTVRLKGPGVAALAVAADALNGVAPAGGSLDGDELTIALRHPHQTRITLSRGAREWPPFLLPIAQAAGRFLPRTSLFDQATLAVGDRTGEPAPTLTLEALDKAPRLTFQPKSNFTAPEGGPLAFALGGLSYAVTLNPGNPTGLLRAHFADEPVWGVADRLAVQFGKAPQTPPAEWTATADRLTAVSFQPAVAALGIAGPAGLIAQATVDDPVSAVSLKEDGGLTIDLNGFEVIRPADLLVLSFAFTGMTLSGSKLVKSGSATMTVTFPPQHIAEEAVVEKDASAPAVAEPAPPVGARAANPSKLTFQVKQDLDFTLDALLNWGDTATFALLGGGSSYVEAPYHLRQLLQADTTFTVSPTPDADKRRTQLWHARAAHDGGMKVAAAAVAPGTDVGFLASLTDIDRQDIEANTELGGEANLVQLEHLTLSALGAWMEARGNWPALPPGYSLESWYHKMAMGRDVKAVVVRKGFLMPFGNRASRITVTERKFRKGRAYLYQRQFIVVREPEVTYGGPAHTDPNKEMPLRTINLRTRVTPAIDPPATRSFWIRVGDRDFPFQVAGTDWLGKEAQFLQACYFVDAKDATGATVDAVLTTYEEAANLGRRTIAMQSQTVAYAPPVTTADTTQSQSTALDTLSLVFGAVKTTGGEPFFRPVVRSAAIRSAASEAFADAGGTQTITLNPVFVQFGYDPAKNPWKIFADLQTPGGVKFDPGSSAGVAVPDINYTTISAVRGPMGVEPPTTSGGAPTVPSFDPSAYFPGSSKLLGVIPLSSLIKPFDPTVSFDVDGVTIMPRIVLELSKEAEKNASKVKTGRWERSLKVGLELSVGADEMNIAVGPFKSTDDTRLGIQGAILRDLGPKAMTAVEKADQHVPNPPGAPDPPGDKPEPKISKELKFFLEKFKFEPFTGFAIVFKEVSAVWNSVKGFDLNVELNKTIKTPFDDVMKFIEQLQGATPDKAGEGSPDEDQEDKLSIGIDVTLTNITLGNFLIKTLGPYFHVIFPLDGKPLYFETGLNEATEQFQMLYYIYPTPPLALIAKGYLDIQFDPAGIRKLTTQIEGGVYMGFSIGPVKGEVSLTAGFYLNMNWGEGGTSMDDFELAAFSRLLGVVSLKVFEVSLEVYVELRYKSVQDQWTGKARVTLSIKVAFVKISFKFQVEHNFSGGSKSSSADRLLAGDALELESVWDSSVSDLDRIAAYAGAFAKSYGGRGGAA